MLQQVRRGQQQCRDGERATHAGQLCTSSRRLRYGSARRTAADRKTLKKAGGKTLGSPYIVLSTSAL
jgi:hypothetical protein